MSLINSNSGSVHHIWPLAGPMTPFEERLAEFVSDFLDRSRGMRVVHAVTLRDGPGIDPPVYLMAVGANDVVVVSKHTPEGNKVICASPGDLVSPVLLTVIGMDGKGSSMKLDED